VLKSGRSRDQFPKKFSNQCNPSSCIISLQSTQTSNQMSTRNILSLIDSLECKKVKLNSRHDSEDSLL
jgi:hypothetical protein